MKRYWFRRVFTKGTLKGIKHVDYIHQASDDAMREFVHAINRNHSKGRLEYKIDLYEGGVGDVR